MKFVIWHVGGGGLDLGPCEQVLNLSGVEFEIYLFEIRTDLSSEVRTINLEQNNPNRIYKQVQIGLAGKSETRNFYVNKFELSSSLLKPSSLSTFENPGFSKWGGIYEKMKSWDENTKVDKIINTKVSTIDEIINAGLASPPDLLSMDIQGVELEVMKSTDIAFKEIIAVITESEFFEIYSGQGLFDEQMAYLTSKSFRFVKFFGFQKWFPGPMVGHGFTTVTESLFIKYLVGPEQLFETQKCFEKISDYRSDKLFKIALVAFAYNRYSYFYTIMSSIEKNDEIFWNEFQKNTKYMKYTKYYFYIKRNLSNLDNSPDYFVKNPLHMNKNINKLYKIIYPALDFLVKTFKLRGIIHKIDQFNGAEKPMD